MPHVRREKAILEGSEALAHFPVSLLLLSSCSFPISQAGIHKIRKGKLMGHYSTTSVYISMKQHVPSSATYASQDRYSG